MSKYKKKVSLFMPGFYGGGGERAMIKIAGGLLEKGVDVEFVVVKNEGELSGDVPEGVSVEKLGSSRILYSILSLARYICREKPSVIISAMTPSNLVMLVSSILSGFEGGKIVCEQNTLSKYINNYNKVSKKVLVLLTGYLYSRADNIVAVSKGVKKDLIDLLSINKDDISVAYNPVFDRSILERSKGKVNLEWFKEECRVILGVGSLIKQKGFDVLVEAFNIVSNNNDVNLLILGDGKCRKSIEEKCSNLGLSEHVKMPGFVDNPIKYMANSDVFVLSSRWEGLPFVLVEALASGTPVVATNCPSGPEEVLEGGKFGPLVPVSDERALAESIIHVLENPDQPATSEQRIRRAQDFSVERSIEKYWSIVEQYV